MSFKVIVTFCPWWNRYNATVPTDDLRFVRVRHPRQCALSETSAPGRHQHPSTRYSQYAISRRRGGTTHARLCLPLCVALCNRRSACTPRVPQPLPSQPAATGLPAAALPPPAPSAAASRFTQTKSPRSLGDILEYWGNWATTLWQISSQGVSLFRARSRPVSHQTS